MGCASDGIEVPGEPFPAGPVLLCLQLKTVPSLKEKTLPLGNWCLCNNLEHILLPPLVHAFPLPTFFTNPVGDLPPSCFVPLLVFCHTHVLPYPQFETICKQLIHIYFGTEQCSVGHPYVYLLNKD